MATKTLIQRLNAIVDAQNTSIDSNTKKDNLTDVASQISNQPSSQQPAQQPQNSNSGNNQNLGSNQVVGSDGTVIDLGVNEQDTIRK